MIKQFLGAAFVFVTLTATCAAENWSTSSLATTGNVVIDAGQSITLDQNLDFTSLTINGELTCADQNLALSVDWIMVHGKFTCGTALNPYDKNFTLT